jgi:hypothetical protein
MANPRIIRRAGGPLGFERLPVFLITLFLLAGGSMIISTPEQVSGTPEGYVTFEDLLTLYPAQVTKSGDDYNVIGDLDLPATKPLFIGPGERILFDENVSLNLIGPPIFQGTSGNMAYLGPMNKDRTWAGISLMEADPSTSPIFRNVTITGAAIGIRSQASDVIVKDSVISNCSADGLDLKGPLGTGKMIRIEDTDISGHGFYGIHILKVEKAEISGLTVSECGTGIRSYKSKIDSMDLEIINSKSLGLNLVDSDVWLDGLDMSTPNGSTNIQILTLNSTVRIFDAMIRDAKTCISSLTASVLYMDGVRIKDSFTDGIQTNYAELNMINSEISGSGESGLHMENTDFKISSTSLINNGEGSGGFTFSSIYTDGSRGKVEGCTITGSGYSNVHALDSMITIGNTTLGATDNEKLLLDGGSRIDLVDVLPPSDIAYMDQVSSIRYYITPRVTLLDYSSGSPIPGGQVDIKNVDNEWVASANTGPDGKTDDMMLLVIESGSGGTFSHLPVSVIAQKDGYEVSTYEMGSPEDTLAIDMYPPNSPPSISLITPVNGTIYNASIEISGNLVDDLGIYWIKLRFDGGLYSTYKDFDTINGGSFTITIPTGNLSGGIHTLWVHAFDGSHISAPESRTILVIDPASDDTDQDGIPDREEDKNGDGILDDDETDPNDPDTDGDGLIDGIEIDTSDGNSTDPRNHDTDGDYLKDGFEDQNGNGRVDPTETDPLNKDTDGDGVDDYHDKYPLNPDLITDTEENEGAIWVLILSTLMVIILIAVVYLFIIKTRGGAGRGSQEEEKVERRAPMPGGRKPIDRKERTRKRP